MENIQSIADDALSISFLFDRKGCDMKINLRFHTLNATLDSWLFWVSSTLKLNALGVCAFVAFIFLGSSAFAQEVLFREIQLSYGISLKIPAHWKVLSKDTMNNLGAASSAMMDNAGIEKPIGKQSLLAVNATPNPTGAMIRVSITSPPEYTQANLAATTATNLKDFGAEMLKKFRQLEASGGPKIIEMQPIRIEKINGQLTLVMPYVRASNFGPSPWQVTQYKTPVSDRLIEVTISYRKSDAIIWRPILEHVHRSVKF